MYVETKVKEPIISFSLFKRRTFAVAQLLAFLYGATFVILAVFIPVFVQAVYGGTARNAGLILMPMMLGSVAGSSFAGISQTKTSYRNIMFISVIAYFTGMLLLSFMTPETSKLWLTIYMVLTGLGVGFSFSLLPSASMHNLEPRFAEQRIQPIRFSLARHDDWYNHFGTIQSNKLMSELRERSVRAQHHLFLIPMHCLSQGHGHKFHQTYYKNCGCDGFVDYVFVFYRINSDCICCVSNSLYGK